MTRSNENEKLPVELDLRGASFYSRNGIASNVALGRKNDHDFVVFDWDTNSGEIGQTYTVVALRIASPLEPATWLSRSSGLQLERVGQWVLGFQPGCRVDHNEHDRLIGDIKNLLEYANEFPQNTQ